MGMDKKIEKKNRTPILIGIIALSVAGLATLLSFFYKDAGISRLNVQQDRIIVDTIHTGVFKEFITIFGTVEPLKTVYLDAVESGKVEEIFTEDGVIVNQGLPILRLSNLDLQLNVLNQEAQIIDQINTIRSQAILFEQQSIRLREQALDVEFQIDLFSKRVARNQSLAQDSAIAVVEYEETQDEYEHLLRRRKLLKASTTKDSLYQESQKEQMESSLSLMKRNLEFAKGSLENLIVKAPIDGQLSSLDAEIGELINRGDRIAQIDLVNAFKIRARIDEYYISRIFPQQLGTFTMNGQQYNLSIQKIYPEVANGTFEVDLVFQGARPDNIKRGQSISLKLSLSDETRAQLLAKGGFFQSTGGNWVYVMDANGNVARRKDIRLGRQNPDFYEVLSGLNNGEVVIVSSYENYGDKDELVIK